MKKKLICTMLATVLTLSMGLAGCASKGTTANPTATPADTSSTDTSSTDTDTTTDTASNSELMTFEFYDVAANYQGIQSGWFGKLIKDKFNIELNIIAPNVGGGKALYQTRTAAGDLGELILLDNPELQECIKAGLIKDVTENVKNSTSLKEYIDQYTVYNSAFEGNESGNIYGLPCQITNTSPTAYSDSALGSSPMFPWDYYSEIGTPEMKNMDDLLDVMEQIQQAHPTNADGLTNYALSLWKDWDGTAIETARQLTKWYGYEVQGSILLGNKGDMKDLLSDDSEYLKVLKFFFDANQRGLLDPDSATQDWDTACTKMKNKQVLLFWYNWQRGFWNTPVRSAEGDGYIYAPVADMDFYQPSDSYYGDGRAFAFGSKLEGDRLDRAVQFMDWLSGPEGLTYLHDGLEGFNYIVEDGKYVLTEDGMYALMENRNVPEEFGGGGYADGQSQINQWPLAGISTDPVTGEPYSSDYWSSTIEVNKTKMINEWSAKYGAKDQIEYVTKTGQLKPVPQVNIILPSDTTDIQVIRGQCGQLTCDTSWRMIYASSEAEFNQMWEDMKVKLEGFGWSKLVEFDTAKYQMIVDARAEAMSAN